MWSVQGHKGKCRVWWEKQSLCILAQKLSLNLSLTTKTISIPWATHQSHVQKIYLQSIHITLSYFKYWGEKKKKLMKFEMFSSGHPSAQAELFTCWTLHIPVPQASDTAERLSFGSCTTKTWKRKPIRENIYIFNHATMYFRVPVSNFLILGGEKVFFMMNENRFGFCVLLDDSFSWKWMRKIIPDWSKCSLLPKL